MAEDAEAEERKRAKDGNVRGRAFARVIENASRLADEGKLTLDQSEKMIRELRQIANPTFKDTALGSYWNDWNKRRARQVAKSTADNYTGALKKWEAVAPDMMKLPLMELDVRHIRDGLAAMQTGGNAIATTNSC